MVVLTNGAEMTYVFSYGQNRHKVPKRRVFWEIEKVERGKPRERETQIMVGEPNKKELRTFYGMNLYS